MDTAQITSPLSRTRSARKPHGELPLVFFTVLVQAAAGSFVILSWFAWRASGAAALLAIGPASALLALAMGAGLLLSFLHLGSPLRAYRALANLRTSWLSREILFASLFTALLVVLATAGSLAPLSSGLRLALVLLAGLAGLALIYSMARVYLLPGEHAWERRSTLAAFLLTPLLLGSLGAALALSSPASGLAHPAAARQAALLALLALGLNVARILPDARRPIPAYTLGYARPSPWPRRRHRLHLALLLAGAALLLLGLALPDLSSAPTLTTGLAFLLAASGELIGRSQFYHQRRAIL